MKTLNRASIKNLRILGEVLYNLTGDEYYLYLVANYYGSQMSTSEKGYFFTFYFENLREAKKLIKSGAIFQYPLYNFGTRKMVLYKYNSL